MHCFVFSLQTTIPLALVVPLQGSESSAGQLQRPLLCHRAPLHHAPLRHHLHRRVQVAHEQAAGLHHVHAVLRLPGGQRHAGGQGDHLSGVHLRGTFSHRPRHRQPSVTVCPSPLARPSGFFATGITQNRRKLDLQF